LEEVSIARGAVGDAATDQRALSHDPECHVDWSTMNKVILMILALAGSDTASGQGGFIAHLDSVQAGRNGRGTAIREVQNGYLLFTTQFSHEFPNRSHVYLRRLDENGRITGEYHYFNGEDRDFYLGFMDAVSLDSTGQFVAAMAKDYSYSGETWLYRFTAVRLRIEQYQLVQRVGA
jgi:hypothetical protein